MLSKQYSKGVGACDDPSSTYDTPAVILGGEDPSGHRLQLDRSQKPSLPSLWAEDSCGRYREPDKSQVVLQQPDVYIGRSWTEVRKSTPWASPSKAGPRST